MIHNDPGNSAFRGRPYRKRQFSGNHLPATRCNIYSMDVSVSRACHTLLPRSQIKKSLVYRTVIFDMRLLCNRKSMFTRMFFKIKIAFVSLRYRSTHVVHCTNVLSKISKNFEIKISTQRSFTLESNNDRLLK